MTLEPTRAINSKAIARTCTMLRTQHRLTIPSWALQRVIDAKPEGPQNVQRILSDLRKNDPNIGMFTEEQCTIVLDSIRGFLAPRPEMPRILIGYVAHNSGAHAQKAMKEIETKLGKRLFGANVIFIEEDQGVFGSPKPLLEYSRNFAHGFEERLLSGRLTPQDTKILNDIHARELKTDRIVEKLKEDALKATQRAAATDGVSDFEAEEMEQLKSWQRRYNAKVNVVVERKPAELPFLAFTHLLLQPQFQMHLRRGELEQALVAVANYSRCNAYTFHLRDQAFKAQIRDLVQSDPDSIIVSLRGFNHQSSVDSALMDIGVPYFSKLCIDDSMWGRALPSISSYQPITAATLTGDERTEALREAAQFPLAHALFSRHNDELAKADKKLHSMTPAQVEEWLSIFSSTDRTADLRERMIGATATLLGISPRLFDF